MKSIIPVIYRYLLLLILILKFSFCGEKRTSNEKTSGVKYEAPVIVNAAAPYITLLDTCRKPYEIAIFGETERKYNIVSNNISETITINPPVKRTLSGWEAGEFAFSQNYNLNQLITNNSVSCGCIDKMGNLWFGTAGGGATCYSGTAVSHFTTAQGLAGNLIRSVLCDKEGNIWFGTNGNGISKYDGIFFTTYTTDSGLAGNVVRRIIEDKEGNIWFGTDGGVSKYSAESLDNNNKVVFTNYTTADGLADNVIISGLTDSNGNLWFGTKSGLSRCMQVKDSVSFKSYTIADGLPANGITAMVESKDGDLWLGTAGAGVSKFNTLRDSIPQFTNYTEAQGLVNNNIQSLNADDEGNVWFATGNGVSKYNSGKGTSGFENYSIDNGLNNNNVHNIIKDKDGDLWFSTGGSGLQKYGQNPLASISEKQKLVFNSERAWGFTKDKKGNLWIATSGSIAVYDGNSFSNIVVKYLTSNTRCITRDRAGNIWWGNMWGACKFDGKIVSTYSNNQGINEAVLSILEDSRGNMWFGTYGQGVIKFDGKTFVNYTKAQGLSNDVVKCIVEDKSGNIWFGTNSGGLCRFDGATFKTYTKAQGLGNNTIMCGITDKQGDLWFGTAGGGVSKYMEAAKAGEAFFKNYTAGMGLTDDIVYAVAEDTIHNLMWFGTNRGLAGLSTDAASLSSDKPEFKVFNSSTGYSISDFNTGSLFIDSDGIVWGGTGDKLIRFNYGAIRRSKTPPPVVIQAVKVEEEQVVWSGLKSHTYSYEPAGFRREDSLAILNEEVITFKHPLTMDDRGAMYEKFEDVKFDSITPYSHIPLNLDIPYKHNHVTFEFAAIETDRPQLVHYQFMLDGYDKNWRPVTTRASADFGNINEGIYTFRLKAKSPDGVWSQPIVYTFRVLPPWYRTWWMYVCYCITFFLSLFLFFRWRTAALRRDKEMLELTVKERTAQVVEQKELVEEKQKEILDSINYAKRIQYALLAHERVLKQHLKEHFVFFQPKDIVSGDFYWATEVRLPEADSASSLFYLAVCDSTGHGVPGAFMSLLNMSFLNEAINEKNIRKPNEILNHVRQRLIENISQDGAQDGMDGILLCFEYLQNSDETAQIVRITYAAANNAPVLIKENTLIELPSDRMPVGKGEKDQSFTLYTIEAGKGDVVYCGTDGYADQFGGPKGKKFKNKQLNDLLLSIYQKPMKKQQHSLSTTIENWRAWATFGGKTSNVEEQVDDILIIGFKID